MKAAQPASHSIKASELTRWHTVLRYNQHSQISEIIREDGTTAVMFIGGETVAYPDNREVRVLS